MENPLVSDNHNRIGIKENNGVFSLNDASRKQSSLLDTNKGSYNDMNHCKSCNITFNGPQMAADHYKGRKHQKTIKQPTETQHCNLCNKILSTEGQIQAHYRSMKHLIKAQKLEVNNGENTYVPAPEVQDGSHINNISAVEVNYVNKLVDATFENRTLMDVNDKDNMIEILRSLHKSFKKYKYVKYDAASVDQLIDMKLTSELECALCCKKFNGSNPVQDHLSSKKHLKKVILLKQQFHLKGIDEKNILPFCKIQFESHEECALNPVTSCQQTSDDKEAIFLDKNLIQEIMLDILNTISEDNSTNTVQKQLNHPVQEDETVNNETFCQESNKEDKICQKNSITSSVKARRGRKKRKSTETSNEVECKIMRKT